PAGLRRGAGPAGELLDGAVVLVGVTRCRAGTGVHGDIGVDHLVGGPDLHRNGLGGVTRVHRADVQRVGVLLRQVDAVVAGVGAAVDRAAGDAVDGDFHVER